MPSIRTVALSGIGGYGEVYGKALLEEGESHGLTLTGCIDPVSYTHLKKTPTVTKSRCPLGPWCRCP